MATTLRPAQVLLTEADQELARKLQRRLINLDAGAPGPTALYRAGLRTLDEADDETLVRAIGQAERRPDLETLQERFEAWCLKVARDVAGASPELEYAYDASRGGRPGSFSNQGRFVVLSLMHDGRILIGGLEAIAVPLQPGQPLPRAQELFPGGLAVMLSMNDEGAELATRAIVAWLTLKDAELEDIRKAIGSHVAVALR
jgi:hypothetical protein